jgi:DNA transposition AAA+ family ATPase
MTMTRNTLLPFIMTEQYKQFKATCDYVRQRRKMGLTHGEAGSGKSSAARKYVEAQPLNPLNGQSSVFYLELEQTDKTDRAFYNAFVGALLREEPGYATAKVAAGETRRLLEKYQYEFIIIDEFQFLQDSGLEAVRTLWDKTNIPIMLITMTGFTGVLKKQRHLQLESRIVRKHRFDGLKDTQIMKDLLPHISIHSHIRFSPDQEDAKAIVEALMKTTRGNFRLVMNVLEQADALIELSQRAHERTTAAGKRTPPDILDFSADVVYDAAEMCGDADL